MTVGSLIAVVLVGLSVGAAPAPTPTPTGSVSGSISITVPLVAGVNDGTGSDGGGTASGGGTGTGGGTSTGGGSGAGGTTVCTVLNPLAAPTPASGPSTTAAHLVIKPSRVAQGSPVLLAMTGFKPNEKVQIVSYPGAKVLGQVTARADGSLTSSIKIPDRQPVGPTTIEATGWLDCHVGNGTLMVVSPAGTGTSILPWFAWVVVLSVLGVVGLGLLFAGQLGWLPIFIRRFA